MRAVLNFSPNMRLVVLKEVVLIIKRYNTTPPRGCAEMVKT